MTADPRDQISEFSEMTDEELALLIGSFFRAIGFGALAGGGFFLIFTLPFGIAAAFGDTGPAALLFALLPLGVALAGTLSGMLLIGLPLTALLSHLRWERARTYSAAGFVGGIAMTVLFAGWLGEGFDAATLAAGFALSIFGAAAGGVTGNIWGSYREGLATHDTAPGEEPDHPANPYHEMIY